ncbi:two-component system sensor histidine kinase EvgS [Pantoea sp. AG1095]|uniref:ATP-binding protein n=1 Tax=Pantoea sp. AG1095 TaxID=2184004 RepID=UPI000D8907C4|nr:transporter substrate-binding domain-containing protein [Pantoea sp. AG1095]PYG47215.1 two-component system sensor histidine kinase EvgS [Pantoea sp. AG1095]
MRPNRLWIYAAFLYSVSGISAPDKLSYVPDALPEVTAPTLTDYQWRWLGQKRELTLALYGPTRPPLTRIDASGRVTGYIPDFSWTLARSLGLTLRIVHFNNAELAYSSLNEGDTDIIFSPAGDELHSYHQAVMSVKVAEAYPLEVVRRSADAMSAITDKSTISGGTPGRLLAALDQGKVQSVILPAGEAYYVTERNYVNSLNIIALSSQPMTAYKFITRKHTPVLHEVLEKATLNLRSSQAGEIIASRWDQGNLIRFISEPLNLTSDERTWRESHPTVTVVASSFNPPFFMKGPDGNYTGIGPELLSLVSLKTGIRFRYSDIGDATNISAALASGDAAMTAPLIWSQERNRDILLTTPFMFTPTVMVTRSGEQSLDDIRSVALIPAQEATDWFRKAFPEAKVTLIGNPGLAMQWVAEGKVDATLNTLISARYLQQGLYQDRLKLQQDLPVPEAAIVFGVRRADPELQSILNKTLGLVPADMVTSILTHWQATPAARFDTWRIYRSEFYSGAAGAVLLILITAVWAGVLRRQVKRTQRAKVLLRQEILFRDRLINGPPRPVYVATPDGQIIHNNLAFEKYLSDYPSQNLALSLFDSRHPLYAVWKECLRMPPTGDEPLESEFALKDSSGRVRQIRHWMTSFHEDDGTTGGFIGGWQDVTDYLSMQGQLSIAREEAERASQTKSRFLATMSHEIRTPLSAIIGLLELQVQENRADTELIRVAHESSQSLLALIGDVLDIARIESDKVTLQPRWCRVSAIAHAVVETFSGLAHQKGLLLSLALPEYDREVFSDENRLRQIIGNLAGNAVKFTQKGEINISVSLPLQNKGRMQIVVRDSGPGISENDQKRLFLPFEQADNSVSGGSGLGLAISRELTVLMNGTLSLESAPGKGSAFTIDIPVETRPVSYVDSVPVIPPRLHSSLKILVVDDHPANRLLVSRQVALLGHSASVADNGRSGLETWQNEKPDIILTDCNMPEMDGLEMTRSIRKQDPGVLIIGITADAQESERDRCLAAGMNACLFRPVDFSRLAETIAAFEPHEPHEVKDLTEWIDLEAMAAFLPDSPQAIREFITLSICETRKDLLNARDAIAQNDLPSARRIFHRVAGTLKVSGIREMGEQCAMLEELAEMDEDNSIIIHHIEKALTTIDQFENVFMHS